MTENLARLIAAAAVAVAGLFLGFLAAREPAMIQGIGLGAFWVSLFGLWIYRRELRRSGKWWACLLVAALILRVVMGLLHLVVGKLFYGGSVDVLSYVDSVTDTGKGFLRGEFIQLTGEKIIDYGTPEYAEIAKEFRLVEHLNGVFYLLVGPDAIGLLALAAVIGFLGSYLFWRSFQLQFRDLKENRFLVYSLFFLPSLIFWTSALGKDSWMLFLLGWGAYSFSSIAKKITLRHVLGLTVSLLGVTYIRYAVGAAVTVAVVGGLLLRRWKGHAAILEPVRISLFVLGGMGLGAIAFSLLVGGGFVSSGFRDIADPSRALDQMLATAVIWQAGFATADAARSTLAGGVTEPTLDAFIRYLPEGMFTFLFRPIVFEAHHWLAVGAALDGTFFLTLILFRLRHLGAGLRRSLREPFVLFCFLTLLLLTVLLSLERNLGAIVRHRSMVIPFVLISLSVPLVKKKTNMAAGITEDGDRELPNKRET